MPVEPEREETRIIDNATVDEVVDIDAAINAVESAFRAYTDGNAEMPAKSYVDVPAENGDFRSMPAAVGDQTGVKWVNVHPDNDERFGLPTVMGLIVYTDPASGYPLAVLDGTSITRLRTGAAAGVATDVLAASDASSLGLLGAGEQAHTQLAAVAAVRDLDTVVVSDLDPDAVTRFRNEESDQDVTIQSGSPQDVAGCDIVSTTTPSRDPILKAEWVDDGTHINAMGADAVGKQELETDLTTTAAVFVDDWEQCSHSGEINVPVSEGVFSEGDCAGTLGSALAGDIDQSRNDMTVFDSTGLAIQDIAVAAVTHEEAVNKGLGEPIDILGV